MTTKEKFENQQETTMSMGWKTIFSMIRDSLTTPSKRPKYPLDAEKVSFPTKHDDSIEMIWFGHSAFFFTIDNVNILVDPMLGKRPSPVSFFGAKRYPTTHPVQVKDFPKIDVVVLSHDHYDHLDKKSIQQINHEDIVYLVPKGVEKRLTKWGINEANIHVHGWEDSSTINKVTFSAAPARHFSGRSLFDRNSTLWCSWVIKGTRDTLFYSGDSGYGQHFKEIGTTYGPFDVAIMECGQYDWRWSDIHMTPEETVQAFLDVKGNVLLPVHWGAFTLAFHPWNEPVIRVREAATQHAVKVATPKIGERWNPKGATLPNENWWKA
ncbi:MBL fold metallo-hydrolase [Paenisporosarcina cavernae]|uniref:Metallo-beta-lactamase domain-containing protein n=1 Tax=Paenisporosarcina cavernae TaxID=2320858 RepID=A0A385YY34_9BACL|nr:MBL fold metallo-hydrolase [Paenisporosarcina cavernae]AYC30528.1 hypothetical protein D3873_12050 [Paenisporosarcina cavernae]